MAQTSIYADIATRTGGNIYIGAIGPVRTGKSTFIKRFMQTFVIPNMTDSNMRNRAIDELPQSGAGRTVMTAEPKFIPEDAAEVVIGDAAAAVRMVDCVGYLVPSALGQFENDLPRMVTTPWFTEEIPMTEAAEIGTRKVISDHATVGVMITTDGSITDIPREEYAEAEVRVLEELKAAGKPFVIVVNSRSPEGELAQSIAHDLSEQFQVSALTADVMNMDEDKIEEILDTLLREFPLRTVDVYMPEWCDSLPYEHWLKGDICTELAAIADGAVRVRDVSAFRDALDQVKTVSCCELDKVDLATGSVSLHLDIPREIFYRIVNEQTGFAVSGDGALLPLLTELAEVKARYAKFANAIEEVEQKGYGVVMPGIEELHLEQPESVRQGNQYGVRLTATAPSIHMMRADIRTTVSPVVGSEKQAEDLLEYLMKEFDGEEGKIWCSNIFGKSLHDLVNDGLNAKLAHMPESARSKYRETLEKIINEGSNGLICIIL